MAVKGVSVRRIGVLASWVVELYTRCVLDGICEAARARGVGVLCFAGDWVEPESPTSVGSIFDFVNADAVDGLILLSATSLRSYEHLSAVAKRFAPLPMVSIGLAAPGVPGVVVDNETSFRRAIEHLIDVHRRRRLVFLGGPARNSDAQIRYGVYCEVLARRGLPLDGALVVQGDFAITSGLSAIEGLLEHGHTFDAIVAANDAMALGALKALAGRGIRVPEDVSLVGFDDDPAGASASPPLTTVRQPTPQVGRQAVEVLLEWLDQGRVSPCTVVPAEMVVRRSCGCLHQHDGPSLQTPTSGGRNTMEEVIRVLRRERLPGHERTAELMAAFRSDLSLGRPARFPRATADAISPNQGDPDTLLRWQSTLSLLREVLLGGLTESSERDLGDRLIHEARHLVATSLRRAPQLAEIERHEQLLALNWLSDALAKESDLPSLARHLETGAARLGVQTWQLALFDETREWAHLVYSRVDGHTASGMDTAERHATRRLLLDRLGERPSHSFQLVLPLYGLRAPKGFLMFEGTPEDAAIFVPLQSHMNANLRRIEREQSVRAAIGQIGQIAEHLAYAVADPATAPARYRDLCDKMSRAVELAKSAIDEPCAPTYVPR